MSLLDDLLAGMAGGGQPTGRAPQSGSAGPDMGKLMASLLPVALAMLTQGSGAQRGSGRGTDSGGGLGGLLGSLLGGAGGGGAGGLGGLLEQFQRAGLGAEADSWVGRGQNQPLPEDALERVFGRDGVAQIARQAGVSESEASRGLSQLLPEVVDHVTPDGQMPGPDSLVASVNAIARRYGVS